MTTTRAVPRGFRRFGLLVLVALLVAACSGGPILANPPVVRPAPVPTPAPALPAADPIPIELPRDDAAHHRLTEWWYYTGHLRDETGGRWGFEYVIFRAERGAFPVTWASHLAVTDESHGTFTYAQRSEIGPQVDRSGGSTGTFDLAIAGGALGGVTPGAPGSAPTGAAGAGSEPWVMAGGGYDRLIAIADASATAGTARAVELRLSLRPGSPPVLHDDDGWVDFGPAGGSYYYSRPRLATVGSLTVDGRRLTVEGSAWFDHQWGDFIAVGGGGWDWFAVNLADGTDLTLSLVRDADGSYPLVYGTLVTADGTVRHLSRDAFRVDVTARWRSPATGVDYPARWRIAIPGEDLEIELVPTVAAQELDTRSTTGVVYWEGSQRVTARRGDPTGAPIEGEAYVELTGYGSPSGARP